MELSFTNTRNTTFIPAGKRFQERRDLLNTLNGQAGSENVSWDCKEDVKEGLKCNLAVTALKIIGTATTTVGGDNAHDQTRFNTVVEANVVKQGEWNSKFINLYIAATKD